MLHTHIKRDGPWENLRHFPPRPKTKLVDLILSLIGLVLIAALVVVWWMTRAPRPTALALAVNANPAPLGSASAVGLRGDLSGFEQNARNLAAFNSPAAFQVLIQSLNHSEPLSKRVIVLTALKDAAPSVTPELINALKDNDQGVRAGAAQVLGLRGEYQAIPALTAATRDPDASVRREAVKALGALGAWQALPRLEQLVVDEPNDGVRQAAIAVTELFNKEIAQAIGVLVPELRAISVTSGDEPQIYAVTTTNLYARHGTAWTLVSRLPDAPMAIATGADPNLIYLATVSAGLYRSLDGGETWKYVQFGLQTPTHLTVTAVVVDPQNSHQVYIALASPGAESGARDSLGINASNDGGATWVTLADSPMDAITTRLVIDPQSHDDLFGIAGNAPWHYALSAPVCSDCVN